VDQGVIVCIQNALNLAYENCKIKKFPGWYRRTPVKRGWGWV